MTTLNRAQDIPDVYHTVEQAMAPAAPVEERTSVILRMREGIFKSSVVVGYPKVCPEPLETKRKEGILISLSLYL